MFRHVPRSRSSLPELAPLPFAKQQTTLTMASFGNMTDLLGDEVLGPDGAAVATATICKNKKTLLLYFSAHWCPPCRGFTPKLVTALKSYINGGGSDAIVCFVSSDQSEDAFTEYFGSMTNFHALLYSKRELKDALSTRYGVEGIPSLVALDAATCEQISIDADLRSAVVKFGGDAFPLTPPALKKAAAVAAEKRTAVVSQLQKDGDSATFGGDAAVVSDGSAPTSLQALAAGMGTTTHVALLFGDGDGSDDVYTKYGEIAAEVGAARLKTVYVPWSLYNESCDHAPLLSRHGCGMAEDALSDKVRGNLEALCGDAGAGAPGLVVIACGDGGNAPAVVTVDAGVRRVAEMGSAGFPWDDAAAKAKAEAESRQAAAFQASLAREGLGPALKILGSDGALTAAPSSAGAAEASESVGAILSRLAAAGDDARVALYFSAHWCGPCRGFTPDFAAVYKELRAAGKPFEVIFVSSDRDLAAFEEYHGEMPWPALPFAQREVKEALSKAFGVRGIPTVVLMKPDGSAVDTEGRAAISVGAEYFPWGDAELAKGRAAKEAAAAAATTVALEKEKEIETAQVAAGVAPLRRISGDPAAWGALDTEAHTIKFDRFSTLAAPTLRSSDGSVYFEVEILDFEGVPQLGFAVWPEGATLGSGDGCGDDNLSWAVDGQRACKWHGGNQPWDGNKWTVGDVVSFLYSPSSSTIAIGVNGGDLDVVFEQVPPGAYPALTGGGICVKYNIDGPFAHRAKCEC